MSGETVDLGDFTQYVDGYHEHVFTEGGYNIAIYCSRDEEPVTVTVGPVFQPVTAPDLVMGWPTEGSCRWPISAYIQEAIDEAEARIALGRRVERDGC